MTRSNIALTEGGGAKKTATEERTVGGVVVQSQYVILDEPANPTYVAIAAATSIATADAHIIELMAPSNAYVRIHRIFLEQSQNASGATSVTFYVYRLTTAGTGGTAITPRPFDTADTAGATAMTLPTAKGTEGVLLMQMVVNMRQTVLATSAQMDDYWLWEANPRGKPIIIPSGTTNGITIKTTGTAGATVNVHIEFTETAW